MRQELPLATRTTTPNCRQSVTIVEIGDSTAVGEGIEVIKLDAVQLQSMQLRARRIVVRIGASVLLLHSTNLPIRTRTTLQSGFMAYVAFGPRAAGTLNGLSIGPDRVLAAGSGIEVDFVVAAGYESVSFLVPPDDIRAHLRGRQREDEFCLPHGVELLQPNLAAAHALYDWGRHLVNMAARQPQVFDLPQTQTAAQVELLETLLATLGSAASVELAPRDLTRQAYSRVVQIAEDYALTHATKRLCVTDLCTAAGVSERTLQYAFKELMGITPVAYLTRLRLHRVRQALRAATHGTTTVTAEALRWGFWHFGDFARAYKECFGELPSDTLRRKPDLADRSGGRDVEF
ncbi:MAG TPA: helix-turn-helix domain-containing protein [Phycisphaerae bacterium]|nr:helix-turn-helix domain-containing protein [Phycisphaerae bacterium]HRY66645.1 helix-turn-helix domain-containing protein [Phycisphaerae bacterium]HSA27652.1 helix-turn-helix domain-containing protein [Phycisphaerae bacterium]